ncbi:hypothetical protein [Georgenia muralis]
MAVGLTVAGVVNGPTISGVDEHTHLDYAWKIAQGELPYAGSELSDYVLDEWACRGQDNLEDALPSCADATNDVVGPEAYPGRGENYNFWHPPGYYAVTAVLATAIENLPLGVTFTTGARLTGALWLATAVVAMYLVLRQWHVRRWMSASGAAVVMGVPSIAHASSTVNNDAPAALIGVAALWILTRAFLHHRTGWVLPTTVAVLAASVKLMSTVAILVAVGVVALTAVPALRERRFADAARRLAVAVGPVVGVALVAGGWSALQAGRGEPGWVNPISGVNTAEITGLPFDEWAPTLTSAFGLVRDFYLQPALNSLVLGAVVALLALLLTASPFVNVAFYDRGRPERMLGWAALLGALAVPILVQGQELFRGGEYFPRVSSRYAVTLLPMTVAAILLVAQSRRFQIATAVVAAGTYLVVLLGFTGLI